MPDGADIGRLLGRQTHPLVHVLYSLTKSFPDSDNLNTAKWDLETRQPFKPSDPLPVGFKWRCHGLLWPALALGRVGKTSSRFEPPNPPAPGATINHHTLPPLFQFRACWLALDSASRPISPSSNIPYLVHRPVPEPMVAYSPIGCEPWVSQWYLEAQSLGIRYLRPWTLRSTVSHWNPC